MAPLRVSCQRESGENKPVYVREQRRPVSHRAEKCPQVDIVELSRLVHPIILEIVDFENDIVRDPLWLDWAQVRAYDGAVWILVSEFNRPNACPRSQVQSSLWAVFWKGREVESAPENQIPPVMREIQPFLLLFVVGHEVFAGAVGVVSIILFRLSQQTGLELFVLPAPILVLIFKDAGPDGAGAVHEHGVVKVAFRVVNVDDFFGRAGARVAGDAGAHCGGWMGRGGR